MQGAQGTEGGQSRERELRVADRDISVSSQRELKLRESRISFAFCCLDLLNFKIN